MTYYLLSLFYVSVLEKNNQFHLVYRKFIIDISIMVQNFVTILGTF